MAYEVLNCCLTYIQDSEDRASIAGVCRLWNALERFTRRKFTINLCYSCTPQQVHDRYPNIETLRIKGKPNIVKGNDIPDTWGGFCTPWVQHLRLFERLVSIEFKRMVVNDSDLSTIAGVMGKKLLCLDLYQCSGFSTAGLSYIATSCTNLRTLSLQYSRVDEIDGQWVHLLALNNKVLENLNFLLVPFVHINMEDLEQIARDCPLVSVKIGHYPCSWFGNFLRAATKLQEFCGGNFSIQANLPPAGDPFDLPVGRLTSLAPIYLERIHFRKVVPVAPFLLKLDLTVASPIHVISYYNILRHCHNLQELKATELIGDEALRIVSLTCTRLKKLHIRPSGVPFPYAAHVFGITQIGIMRIAKHCRELECFCVYVAEIGNFALDYIGRYLKNLKHFELQLFDRSRDIPDFPLDDGVRALLQGCQNIRRFGLYLMPGALTDTGLGYIGLFGQHIRSLNLWFLGVTDAGLLNLSNGCPELQMLEVWWCNFTLQAISTAATRLPLRYISVQGYRVTQEADLYFQGLSKQYWNIEQIIMPPVYEPADRKFLAYFSIAGQRTDAPRFVLAFVPGPRPIRQSYDFP